jgi:hypothetical protein
MFSTTLKRSVATLGVLAGLLAAAVPAGAQGGGADFTRFVVPERGVAPLKYDSNEVAIEGFMDYTDDALGFSGDAYVNEMGVTAAGDDVLPVAWGKSPQGTQASLGRENSIECLLRAEASDEGLTQSRKPAPLNMTLCHEGFEIQ